MPQKVSAGLLMYRWRGGVIQVFLAHPGGPFFARKDRGHWTIPKGEVQPGEELLDTARREFLEETGIVPAGDFLPLASIRQRGGKIVHGWAFEGEWDDSQPIRSSLFRMEWPPLSGSYQEYPEVDRAQFFHLDAAYSRIKDTQRPFIDRLVQTLRTRPATPEIPALEGEPGDPGGDRSPTRPASSA